MSKKMTPFEREAYAFGYDMGKMAGEAMSPGDYELGRRVGVKAEREAIVLWLCEDADLDKDVALDIAGCIERREHLHVWGDGE